MHGKSLKRAERLARGTGLLWSLIVLGCVSAFLVPLLVFDLGLVLRNLVSPESASSAKDVVLGPLFGSVLGGLLTGAGPWHLIALIIVGWCLALLEFGSLVILHALVNRYSLRVALALRRSIHDQTFVLGPHDLLGSSRSRPEELFTERCDVVRRGLALWWQAIPRSVVELALLVGLALLVNFWLTLVVILLTLYILPFARSWRRRSQDVAAAWHQTAAELGAELLASLRLAPLAIGYSLDWPPSGRFDELLQRHAAAQHRQLTSEERFVSMMVFVMIIAVSFVLLIVGIAPGTSVVATVLWGTALLAAYFPARKLFRLNRETASAEEAAADILAYLDRQPSVIQVPDAKPLDRLARDIKFDKVTIANREGHRLLDNISFTIPAGQLTAIVASDAQTPLAIAGLFVRFYDPAAGRILYDDCDIGKATLETVRGQAMLVTADGPLFPGNVSDNVACGRSGYTALQIADVLRVAEAQGFVQALPEGVNTNVGTDGLRPDQSFRLGLARALLRGPSLLVVQEPCGPFDEATNRELDAALKNAAQGRTLVILASRISTLRSADCICLFHEAQLTASGKHANLIEASDLYRHLNYMRFNPYRNVTG